VVEYNFQLSGCQCQWLAWLTPDPILVETWVWEPHVNCLVFEIQDYCLTSLREHKCLYNTVS